MTNVVTAWSYSRWSIYSPEAGGCPAAFKYKHLDKLPEPDSPAMARGNEIHEKAAAFVSTPLSLTAPALPLELCKFSAQMIELQKMPAENKQVEQEWGFNQFWKPTGWFSADTWFRAKLDVCVTYPDNTADVIDHKTGKEYPSHVLQTELFALATFCKYPKVNHVVTRLWYLDTGKENADNEYFRPKVPELIEQWEKRVAPMFADTKFLPRPNDKCRWCPYAKSKEGPCKFG